MFNFLNGYKTVLGVIAGIAAFVLVITKALSDGFQFADVEVILAGLSALLVAIGLGSKAERILSALKK